MSGLTSTKSIGSTGTHVGHVGAGPHPILESLNCMDRFHGQKCGEKCHEKPAATIAIPGDKEDKNPNVDSSELTQ